jgi:predicted RNase H-like HicB family nuclease
MSQNLREEAKKLASRHYFVKVNLDETTDNQPIYLAHVLELEGCFGQGRTIEQAISDLKDAIVDYIESLLEEGRPIPSPTQIIQTTSSTTGATFVNRGDRVEMKQEERSDNYINLFVPAG